MVGDRWGVSDEEVRRRYPCDDVVRSPAFELWRGVTVRAAPEQVWPWVRQLQLAPYSYDWIDNLGRRSPRALQEVAEPRAGQAMSRVAGRFPVGRVVSCVPQEQLTARVLGAVLSYVLVPQGSATRLLMKVVVERGRWYGRLLALGDWPMARRQLLNWKELAEASAGSAPLAETDPASGGP